MILLGRKCNEEKALAKERQRYGGRTKAEVDSEERAAALARHRAEMQTLFNSDPTLQKLKDPELFQEFSKVQE